MAREQSRDEGEKREDPQNRHEDETAVAVFAGA